jgi:hypothetical protein
MIAEPWDIGPGGYQLGRFPPWLEWNDRFRDDVRRFWRGDGALGALATRLAGSADLFGPADTHPCRSVNFLAAHDGFTLADCVSYAHRHNHANGEDNRDGHGENHSWNCGVEGPSGDPHVLARRHAAQRALLGTLFASTGTIMLTAGDEFGRTQLGNNNAYAQDNPLGWIDWHTRDTALEAHVARLSARRAQGDMTRFPQDGQWLALDGAPMDAARWEARRHPVWCGIRPKGRHAAVSGSAGPMVWRSVELSLRDKNFEEKEITKGQGPLHPINFGQGSSGFFQRFSQIASDVFEMDAQARDGGHQFHLQHRGLGQPVPQGCLRRTGPKSRRRASGPFKRLARAANGIALAVDETVDRGHERHVFCAVIAPVAGARQRTKHRKLFFPIAQDVCLDPGAGPPRRLSARHQAPCHQETRDGTQPSCLVADTILQHLAGTEGEHATRRDRHFHPVLGLRPMRSDLSLSRNVPNRKS